MSSVVVGLGKTGLSCARYLHRNGIPFQVVDESTEPPAMAALREEMPEVVLRTGAVDVAHLLRAKELIVSPGVPVSSPWIREAARSGVTITGDIDIFSKVAARPIVAVTGSNAKSTVTALVGRMIEDAGFKVGVGGNIGTPALDLLLVDVDFYVLELSSFQLETTQALGARVATVLNLSPDHLDRYADEEEYYDVKGRVFSGCVAAVVNRDLADRYALPPRLVKASFGSSQASGQNEFGLAGETLMNGDHRLLDGRELTLRGRHNYLNVLASLAIGRVLELPMDGMLESAVAFRGLPHRCQLVGTAGGVSYYNDSKATNVAAAAAAIRGIGETVGGQINLIAGGVAKDRDFTPLSALCRRYVRCAVVLGRDAAVIADSLAGTTTVVRAASLEEAVMAATAMAEPGDAVLLSPACASLDMFSDFEQRGDLFAEIVRGLGSQ